MNKLQIQNLLDTLEDGTELLELLTIMYDAGYDAGIEVCTFEQQLEGLAMVEVEGL